MNRLHGTVVIGGGLAGLATAVRLVEAGMPVTLIEATQQGGGRARSFDDSITGREIDNGQHLMMGCYHETQSFFRSIGADSQCVEYQRNMAVHMRMPGGKAIDLNCPALPAPLHLAAGLLSMRGLGLLHRASALRAGLMLRSEIERPDDNETCDAWLRRMGQSQTIRKCFWEPLIWAVLNDDPFVVSAAMLLAVLERAFLGTRDASRLGVPKLPLSKLYVDRALDYLRSRGAKVMMGQSVRQLVVREQQIQGVILRDGQILPADSVVSCVPPHVLLALLPEPARRHLAFRDIAKLDYSPIINLWATISTHSKNSARNSTCKDENDYSLLGGKSFAGLVDSPLHWIFDRDQIEGISRGTGRLYSITISGARSLMHDNAESLRELLRSELERYFPQFPMQIHSFRVVKEKRATISHAAGTYQRRPETQSPVRGLLLAGDWVRTGLPATIESAVQSGHMAANAILDEQLAQQQYTLLN